MTDRPSVILIADHDEDILELVCLTLEQAGHETIRASDGDEALPSWQRWMAEEDTWIAREGLQNMRTWSSQVMPTSAPEPTRATRARC